VFGVVVNSLAIVLGGLIGLAGKRFVSQQLAKHLQVAIGFCGVALATKLAMSMDHFVWVMGSVLLGGTVGYALKIEARTQRFADRLQKLFIGERESRFAQGLSVTTILYCVGAMAVIGAINSGARGDHEVLFAKALYDGITSVPMAALYGAGVIFSSVTVFIYQGSIALAAAMLGSNIPASTLNDLAGVGGVLIMMISFNMIGLTKIAVGDFIPSVALILLTAFWF